MSYRSPTAEAHGARMSADRHDQAAREAERRRLLTDEEAAALTLTDWDAMTFEARNRLYGSSPEHYARLRDESLNQTA